MMCMRVFVGVSIVYGLLRRQLNVKIRTTSPELAHASQYGLYNWNEANTRSGSFAMLSLYHEVYVSFVPMVAILWFLLRITDYYIQMCVN
jgi:hypothetical protein